MTQPEAMGVELLPCPFCGAQANSHQVRARSVRFVCPNCEASGPIADGNPEQEQVWNDARSAWNRRATPAVDGLEVVERLRALADTPAGTGYADAVMHVYAERPVRQFFSDLLALSAQVQRLTEENEALRGLVPELPPYPPEGDGLPRFGLRWNGPAQPLAVPMEDGYWTPYHLASLFRRDYQGAERELSEVSRAIGSVRWMDPPDGGDVSLGEQVSRMRADLEAAEARTKALEEALGNALAAGLPNVVAEAVRAALEGSQSK